MSLTSDNHQPMQGLRHCPKTCKWKEEVSVDIERKVIDIHYAHAHLFWWALMKGQVARTPIQSQYILYIYTNLFRGSFSTNIFSFGYTQ